MNRPLTLLFPAVACGGARGSEARALLRGWALDVLKVVVAFTLAHSLRLTLAVLGLVQLPSRRVDCGRVAAVLLRAPDTPRPVTVHRRWVVAFGLRHTPADRRAFMPAGAIAIGAIAAYWPLARLAGGNLG